MPYPASPTRRPWSPVLRASAGLHLAGAATVAAFPAQWPWVAGTLFADHCVLATLGMLPRSRGLGPNLTRLPAARAASGEVALTFDDGPDPEVTPRVLDLLDRAGARATFFAIGRRAAQHPEVAAAIVAAGHTLENHTDRHSPWFAFYDPWRAGREIGRAQATLASISGRTPVWFRAPAGVRGPWLDPVLGRRGLTLASWTRRAFDTVDGNPSRVLARLTRGLAAGDVLLLHDGSAARTQDGEPVVLAVLPRLLAELAARGLRSVPLPPPEDGAA